MQIYIRLAYAKWRLAKATKGMGSGDSLRLTEHGQASAIDVLRHAVDIASREYNGLLNHLFAQQCARNYDRAIARR